MDRPSYAGLQVEVHSGPTASSATTERPSTGIACPRCGERPIPAPSARNSAVSASPHSWTRQRQKGSPGRGAVSPLVAHASDPRLAAGHGTHRLAQAGHSVTRSRQQIRPGGESPSQLWYSAPCQGRGYGRIIDRRGLARVTFSISNSLRTRVTYRLTRSIR